MENLSSKAKSGKFLQKQLALNFKSKLSASYHLLSIQVEGRKKSCNKKKWSEKWTRHRTPKNVKKTSKLDLGVRWSKIRWKVSRLVTQNFKNLYGAHCKKSGVNISEWVENFWFTNYQSPASFWKRKSIWFMPMQTFPQKTATALWQIIQ